ncbi:FAD-dependent oxidoreductase [Neptunomonas sp. XY-337]|uniref:NAD(P)/FAD-dependent oxidoreductase n=1 Tax=Neptunomonas sp. XY-337 TaxID=2561897 RepID=UPI0010AA5F36|nr:FAD-dependent oxidoreductase [Neptunomonas sp. XY-337]
MESNNNLKAIHPRKIAVIGSGISGLSCAWLLNQVHDVTLYEKDDRLGGHSNTITCSVDNQIIDVDTGFIVYNPVNYPNLVRFFESLQVETCETDMSFAVSINSGQLEYAGTGLAGLLAQKRNTFRPTFWKMVRELLRFYRDANTLHQKYDLERMSLGELLKSEKYADTFIYDHLLPMGAAIWSTPVDKMLNYPAGAFLRFCQNHGLVQLKDRPQWRTVVGGSRQYVDKVADALGDSIRLNSRVHKITRFDDYVVVEDHHGNQEIYDDVVLACHSDQALSLLADATEGERTLLQRFPYQRNKAYLHLDASLMPQREAAWSSWNYLSEGERDDSQRVSVTYWMNKLQPLGVERPVFVSLNPLEEPAQGTILRSFFYDHPEFGKDALTSQQQLWSLQGKHRTWFCGAYFGYGFHEDGIQSGIAVAEQLGGIPRPWQLDEPNTRIFVTDTTPKPLSRPQKEQAHG